ncbi:MAG: TetR/AcrR family transcriptional regulator [Ktedonobacteraceae bacterium]|nr:TetR/AcrR family transcriptional regulator [Ktedonobacteraceae bacterium]
MRRGQRATKRQEREQRILDTAAELLQRWGYRKTTIDDIARQAGVAKGTIYLHWKTREELFETLLIREWLKIAQEFQRRMREHPEGFTLSAVAHHAVSLIMGNPLIKDIITGNSDLLEALSHLPVSDEIIQMRVMMGKAYIELLREYGMVRTDMPVEQQIKLLLALSTGFLIGNTVLPENLRFPPEAMADMLAEVIRRTFEPSELPAPEAVQEVTHTLEQMLQQLIERIQAQMGGEFIDPILPHSKEESIDTSV